MAQSNTLQAYTPGSDIAVSFQPNQIVWGRTGNDTIVGYNTTQDVLGQSTLDVMVGDIEIPLLVDPRPRNWRNKFVLGDWQKSYYANGNPFLLGLNDLSIIIDFDLTSDTIQLNGKSSDYQIFEFGIASAIWHKQEVLPGVFVPDIIAIIPTVGLDLNATYFKYAGSAPAAPTLAKAKQIGTTGFDIGNSITVDKQGNVYVAGGTSGDLGGPNQGNRDVWFAKYDPSGKEIWRQQIGSDTFDFPFGIAVDSTGNVYLSGSTQGNLGTLSGDVLSDAWLAKFNQNGDPVWLRQFGNAGYFAHNAYSIDVDAKGNIDISGVSVKFTAEGASLPNTADAWVARYDTNGNQKWFKQFGTPNDDVAFDESYAISLDTKGNVYTTGFTTGAIGSNAYGGLYDAWVAKNDQNGNRLWAKNIGSIDYDWAWGVDTDSQGNVYVTGWTLGDLGGTNYGSFDAWLAKFDKNGNQKWIQQFGTSGDDQAFGVKVGNNDDVYVTGYTDGAFAGNTNSGEYDGWVAKFNGRGEQNWVQQFGSAGTEQAYDITVSNDNYVYVTGITDGSLGTANQGSFDAWVVKIKTSNGKVQDFTDNGTSKKTKQRGLELDLNRNLGKELAVAQPLTPPPNIDPQNLPSLNSADITKAIGANLAAVTGGKAASVSGLQDLVNAATTNPYGSGTNTIAQINDPFLPASKPVINLLSTSIDQPAIFPT
jgi:Beta-propeller repeat